MNTTHGDGNQEPPAHIVSFAVEISGWSPCRSKRGSVIFSGDDIVAHGHNHKPQGFECDGSEACKATCRIEAVHAEQRALLAAGVNARGAEMLHVKSVDGQLVASGGPSCVQCSKLALVSGITAMWLFHEDGWRRYETADWHRQSLAFVRNQQPSGLRGDPVVTRTSSDDTRDPVSASFHSLSGAARALVEQLLCWIGFHASYHPFAPGNVIDERCRRCGKWKGIYGWY